MIPNAGHGEFFGGSWDSKSSRELDQFAWLQKCKVSSATLRTNQLPEIETDELTERFEYLSLTKSHACMSQPLLIEMNEVGLEFQGGRADLQSNRVTESVFKVKGALMRFSEEARSNSEATFSLARDALIHFPSSYQVECAFSHSYICSYPRLHVRKSNSVRLATPSVSVPVHLNALVDGFVE